MFIEHLVQALSQQIFFTAAMLLLLGFVFSWIIRKIKLPRVTGYIMAGIIFGPSLLKVFQSNSLAQLEFIPQFALGVIALVIGAGLSFSLLKRLGFGLLLIALCESLGAFFLVFILLYFLQMPLGAILPLAAIAAATAPAATVAVIREYQARGPLTDTTLAVVALDDAVAITLFGLVMTLDLKHLSSFGQQALHSLSDSLFEIIAALLIGIVLAFLAHLLIKLTKETTDSLIIIIGVVLLAITIAGVADVSPLLTNMFLGMFLINIAQKNTDVVHNLERFSPPIYCFFFVLAGAHLDFSAFFASGSTLVVWGLFYVLARFAGKVSGAFLGGTVAKVSPTIRKYLGFALAPQAGVAIGLTLLINKTSSFYEYRTIILNITLMAVAINEIFGPLLTKYALFKAKEATSEG